MVKKQFEGKHCKGKLKFTSNELGVCTQNTNLQNIVNTHVLARRLQMRDFRFCALSNY